MLLRRAQLLRPFAVTALGLAQLKGGTAICSGPVAPARALTTSPQRPPAVRSLVLYQYQACPFCNKVRAFLDFHKVPYVVVEVDPITQSAIKWSSHKKVPLAVINGVAIGESNVIIDHVGALLDNGAGKATAEEAQWRAWVDDKLVRLLTVSIYRTIDEAAQASNYITQRNFSPLVAQPAKWFGTVLMFLIAKRMRTKYSIPEDVRGALYAELDSWVAAVGDARFLGGDSPSKADLCVFGALRAVQGLDTERDMFAHSGIRPWFERMTAAVGASALEHRVGEAPSLA